MSMEDEKITIELTKAEAWVLSEWLYRFNKNDDMNPDLFNDQAEQRALWNLEAVLERILALPPDKDYAGVLEEAYATLRYPEE